MKSVDSMTVFKPISKTEWLEKVQKDLKGARLQEFEWHLADDLQFDPFIHSSDLNPSEINFLKLKRISNKMPLAVINKSEPSKANLDALDQLRQGAGSILFNNLSASADNLYKDISLEMISVFHQDEVLSIDATPDHFPQWRSEMIASCRSVVESNVLPKSLLLTQGNNLFLNVCCVRATRIVFQQLAIDLDLDIEPFKIISLYKLDESKDLEENLQLSMPKAFAAFVGGADHIGPMTVHRPEDTKWYHNLVHLLLYESGMPLNSDTLSGAFLFESLTNKIADSIWSHLLNIDEK